MKRRMIVALTAGAALGVAGCGKETPPADPVVQSPKPPPVDRPPPDRPTMNPPPMPSWDQVDSNHPPGATNPPSPQLVIDYRGYCHKRWVDPRRDNHEVVGVLCEGDCGTQVRCEPDHKLKFDKWRAPKNGRPSWESVASSHPEGATNPPRPVLLVDTNANCYKDWTGGMIAPTPETNDRVVTCTDDCEGTLVECPTRAYKMLKAYSNPLDQY